ncbi:MAG: MFS transporter, partial [Anaerolineales bacterium]|nr:MFS transporter [Anaerolineales bacterium]
LGFGVASIGMTLTAWAVVARSFGWILVGSTLFGMGRGASEQARYVAAEVQPPAQRAKVIGLIVFAGTIGAVGGPLLVAPSETAAARVGIEAVMAGPFVLSALLTLLGFLFVFGGLRPDPKTLSWETAAAPDDAAAAETAVPLRQLFARPAVLLALASMTIGQLVMTLIMVITPLHMNHLNHATESVSLVIMAHTLGMFGLSTGTGWLIDRYGRVVMIIAGAALLILSSIMAPFAAGVPMLAVALFILGLGWNFCFVAGSSLLSDALAGPEKGRVQGASEVIVALSSGAGSLGTGSVFASGGMLAVGGVGLAFTLLLFAILAWSSWARRPTLSQV